MWIFWLTVIISATATYKADSHSLTLFFAGTLGVVIITDISKVFMAARLKTLLTDNFLILINNIAGIALVLFGLFLILRAVFGF